LVQNIFALFKGRQLFHAAVVC